MRIRTRLGIWCFLFGFNSFRFIFIFIFYLNQSKKTHPRSQGKLPHIAWRFHRIRQSDYWDPRKPVATLHSKAEERKELRMQRLHKDVQPAEHTQCPSAFAHGRPAVYMQNLQQAVHSDISPQGPSSCSHGRTAFQMRCLRKEFQSELHPKVAYANPHGREVSLRHMSEAVQHEVRTQVAQAKAAQQRAALQVRCLPEKVHQCQQTAPSLEDEQLRATQRRRAVTWRFERLRYRR